MTVEEAEGNDSGTAIKAEATTEPEAGAEAEAGTLAATVVRYPVAPGYRLNVRSGPGTHYSLLYTMPLGVSVPVYCQKPGTTVSGPYGTSNLWDNIANGEFVSDAYVNTGSDGYVAPRCA